MLEYSGVGLYRMLEYSGVGLYRMLEYSGVGLYRMLEYSGVGLYRMLEYSGFILVNRNTLGQNILSDVTGCRKTQVSDCTGSTVLGKVFQICIENYGVIVI
jgi:hypothetical protein